MPKSDPVQRALDTLIKSVRTRTAEGIQRQGMTRRAIGLIDGGRRAISLDEQQTKAFYAALAVIDADPRFEWIKSRTVNDAVWRLACDACGRPSESGLAEQFVTEFARALVSRQCFFPVVGLSVERCVDIAGVRTFPAASLEMPEELIEFAKLDGVATPSAIVAVAVEGTSDVKMAERARERAVYALRILRFSLADPIQRDARQLRFQLERYWWAEGGGHQWKMPRHDRLLTVSDETLAVALENSVAGVPQALGTNLDDHVRIALAWFERSQLEDDALSQLLYLFFALEAILSEQDDKLKGLSLAMRRATLGHLVTGSFRDPAAAYTLYDQVRSKAVHGGKLKYNLAEREVQQFSTDVHDALSNFLTLARERAITRRHRVLELLDNDEARGEVEAHVHARNPKLWETLGLTPND